MDTLVVVVLIVFCLAISALQFRKNRRSAGASHSSVDRWIREAFPLIPLAGAVLLIVDLLRR